MARRFLIVGGGLVGTASALRLQNAGFEVTLIDPGDKRRGASFGNVGHIAAEQVWPWASPANLASFPSRLFAFGGPLDFRWRDVGLWLPWSLRFMAATQPAQFARGTAALTAILARALPAWERISALAGAPDILRSHEHAVVWMDASVAERGIAMWRRTPTGSCPFREMSAADLARYSAAMPRAPAAGIVFSNTGHVKEPQAARDALTAAFLAKGGKQVVGRVVRVESNSTGVRVHITGPPPPGGAGAGGGGPSESSASSPLAPFSASPPSPAPPPRGGRETVLEADHVLIAAGAWSRALMRTLGVNAPLIGERGYSMQSAQHSWPADLWATAFEERSLFVTPFVSGLRCSSFLEFGDPSAPGDPRKWRKLQQHVRELGVAYSETPDFWVGPRPTLPDYVPAIGRLERAPNVFYAFGHAHLGLTMSAATAEIIEALATGEKAPIDLSAMRVERFS